MLILLFLLLFLLLLFPETATEGSKNGLILWATVLVPSLLPFSVLTSLVRQKIQGTPLKYLLLTAGILSGYPIGAKISGELYRDGALSQKESLFFAGFTNNPSAMFVIFFVAENLLHLSNEKYIFYLFVLLSSLAGSLTFVLLSHIFQKKNQPPCRQVSVPGISLPKANVSLPKSPVSIGETLDAEISASALLLLKIGGYIMMFSILTAMLQKVTFLPLPIKLLIGGLLEITTGNAMLCQTAFPHSIKIILSLAITTFGGLSAAAQTNSVLQNTGLSFIHYVIIKLLSSGYAVLLAVLFLI